MVMHRLKQEHNAPYPRPTARVPARGTPTIYGQAPVYGRGAPCGHHGAGLGYPAPCGYPGVGHHGAGLRYPARHHLAFVLILVMLLLLTACAPSTGNSNAGGITPTPHLASTATPGQSPTSTTADICPACLI